MVCLIHPSWSNIKTFVNSFSHLDFIVALKLTMLNNTFFIIISRPDFYNISKKVSNHIMEVVHLEPGEAGQLGLVLSNVRPQLLQA